MQRLYYILTLIYCLICTNAIQAQKMGEIWVSLPENLVPTIEPNRRMDMVDLYNAGHKASATTLLGGNAEITAMGDSYINVSLSDCNTIQIKKITTDKQTLYVIINTVFAPAGDSRITIYDENWKQLDLTKLICLPRTADFITIDSDSESNNKNISTEILLPTLQYAMNEATCDISVSPTFDKTLDNETFTRLSPYIITQRTYRWNGRSWKMIPHTPE